jgi:voltage-dependent calcium channel T type alpha-1G
MYNGIDAVDVDKQPIRNYHEAKLIYFISFLLLVGFFVINMFVGVVVENFHKCRAEQEREEKARRTAKRAKKIERKKRRMREIPYYAHFSPWRRRLHDICNSKYFDLIIAAVIGLNVVTMSLEFYLMPQVSQFGMFVFSIIFSNRFLKQHLIIVIMYLQVYLYLNQYQRLLHLDHYDILKTSMKQKEKVLLMI